MDAPQSTPPPSASAWTSRPLHPGVPTVPLRPSVLTNDRPARVPFWLYVVVLLIFAGTVLMQRPVPMDPKQLADLKSGEIVRPESFSIDSLLGKLMLFVRGTGSPPVPTGVSTSTPSADDLPGMILKSVDDQAAATELAQDLFRAAVLAGEFKGFAEMKSRLDALTPKLSPTSDLHQDSATVTALYAIATDRALRGTSGISPPPHQPGANGTSLIMPSDADVQALIDRHGWVGKLAATAPQAWDTSTSSPAPATPSSASSASIASPLGTPPPTAALTDFRSISASHGTALMVVFTVFGGVVLLSLFTGFVLLITGVVLAASGKLPRWPTPWRDDYPELSPALRSGRVWLETFGLFIAGFLALLLLRDLMPYQQLGIDPLWFVLLSQWVLVLVLFWPVVRGMPWRMFRALVGWHRGRGLPHEIGFGFLAYLATLPVYVFCALLVVLLMLLYEAISGHTPAPPSTDRLTGLASGGPLQLAMVVLLASVWAPLVEETIFRGCVYRFLRGKAGSVVAAVLSSLAFAAMHGYMFQQLMLVGVLGAAFALMRAHRGSLIPCMFAHCLHNTVVFTLLALVVGFGSDV